ncbi:FYVE and coiled-coil domain-containing protein 1 [Megalops cyprinoides]|uniref:FYVE and coiled-coil domain-containing protein 1 n=1 Tax=Megalops cyprinoides TaxID=118141 RepID=UPI0018653AB4|nr:FYVE and coiled-coil domain-containing protein 1 [Megalops cyprinoides]
MATSAAVGESQLQRIIRDLQDAVAELTKEYRESGEPITDDSSNLHKFSYKLEYLLQFDQKEKTTFLGTRKDYWDYFIDCLAKIKGANDGIRFVKSIPELKTSLGKGRAFIRYSLVHQRLADTLQQCLMNQRVTSDWYYARSPFLKPHLSVDIINHLYELNEVQFDVASRGHDLDSAWPTFARRTLGLANSPAHMWKPPSRSSSINSLVSTYSQQAQEFPCSPDLGHGLLDESGEPPGVGTVDELRLELDRSELKQQELLERVRQMSEEGTELRRVVEELQAQLDVALASHGAFSQLQQSLRMLEEDSAHKQRQLEQLRREAGEAGERAQALAQELDALRGGEQAREEVSRDLRAKLATAEQRNVELMARLDGVLSEKGQQTASYFDSAQKIHDLLDKLNEAEREKLETLKAGEERARLADRLAEEVRQKEAVLRDNEARLAALTAAAGEERARLLEQAEELHDGADKLQGALTLKEKEASNLQMQLQVLQSSLEARERQAEELKRRTQEEKEELQQRYGSLKDSLEGQLQDITEQLRAKEKELSAGTKRVQDLEKQAESMGRERDALSGSVAELEGSLKDQSKKMEEYKTQCASLMELNGKLLQTVKRNEETKRELTESRAALEGELAALRALEKQLRGQLEDAKVTVDEKERRLREENRRLEEACQRALLQRQLSEAALKKLEQENRELREEQATVKGALSSMQAELRTISAQISELEKSLAASRKSEADLQEQLREKAGRCRELEARVEVLEQERSGTGDKEAQEATSRLSLVEAQLDLNLKEVSRLQAEVLELRAKLQSTGDEEAKVRARLEVAEASRDELKVLTEQLQGRLEELNRGHLEELQHCRLEEEVVRAEGERARADLVSEANSAREELTSLKERNEKLVLEVAEAREGLHRANMEMAELGITVCKLTSENQEARQKLADVSARLREVEEEGAREMDRLTASMATLREENAALQEDLGRAENLPTTVQDLQGRLERAETQAQSLRESTREEIAAVKFQMSSEAMNYQNQIKTASEEVVSLQGQLKAELEKVSRLETRVSDLEAVNGENCRLIGEKHDAAMQQKEEELQRLRENLERAEADLSLAKRGCEELKEKLETALAEKQSHALKMAAEVDDLCRTKTNLEERLIELIRDKDALWQKSDALEFEQKLRAEEQWWLVDKEATHCLGCQSQFTWLLRRHHCRLCGRIFCYYCSNNFVMTKHGGKKERCCRDCYSQHSAVVERLTQAELGNHAPPSGPAPAPYTPTPRVTVTDPSHKPDDGTFDIITEEEVNGIYDSDSLSQTTGDSPERDQGTRGPPANAELSTSTSTGGDTIPDDPEELMATVQDAEIYLLKSGELTLSVPLTLEEIAQFGDASRELFIKSSCYSMIPMEVREAGHTISWVFSSEPKSISFSVVYREAADAPLEQAKVLIPLTRCDSHKETIQGQLKVRNPGTYTLIFDNSFSRFISKKVLYHLTIEKPIIYDGSDFP